MRTAKSSTIKAVLFDLYGTLVDVHIDTRPPRIWRTLSQHLAEHGITIRSTELRNRYHDQVARDACEYGEPFVLNREFFDELVRNGSQPHAELVSNFARLFRQLTTHSIRLRSYAFPLLTAIRTSHCKIGLVSNTDAQLTDHDLDVLRLRPCFDTIVFSSQVGVRKPDSRIFELAVRQLGVERHEAVHIGDDYTADYLGATSAQLSAVLLGTHDSRTTSPRLRDLLVALRSRGWKPAISRAA